MYLSLESLCEFLTASVTDDQEADDVKQQKIILSQLRRLQVWGQGIHGFGPFRAALLASSGLVAAGKPCVFRFVGTSLQALPLAFHGFLLCVFSSIFFSSYEVSCR